MFELRYYQKKAVAAVYRYLKTNKTGSPCVVLPTGAGKTPALATFCRDVAQWGGRALVIAHVKELLQQSAKKIAELAPDASLGVYSAGLGERTTDAQIVVAGIQSIYQRAEELGPFQLIIVDEAHMIPADGDGRYRTFLAAAKNVNPNVRVVGLTATPYRLGSGWICGDDKILTEIVYEIGVRELIAEGFLSPIRVKNGRKRPDFSSVSIRGGEYVASEVAKIVDAKNVVERACVEIAELTKDRKKVVVFCATVESAKRVAKTLRELTGAESELVTGETKASERDAIIERFKSPNGTVDLLGIETPPLKYLCNVNVLTTGFDAPNVDCVVLLRPTESVGLYQQMVGRGLRLAPGKNDCLVLDYGQNVVRLGPIDMPNVRDANGRDRRVKRPPPARECPNCATVSAAGYSVCPECGTPFPAPPDKTDATASGDAILDEGFECEYEIDRVEYSAHEKKNAPPGAPRTLQVAYEYELGKFVFEWLCPEHPNDWLRRKFEKWWRARSKVAPPRTAEDAATLANAGALATPTAIRVVRPPGKKFNEIEWTASSSVPDFDLETAVRKSSPYESFDEFDRYDEPEPPRRTSIYGVCSGCLAFNDGWCSAREKRVGRGDPICEQFVVNDDDIPF